MAPAVVLVRGNGVRRLELIRAHASAAARAEDRLVVGYLMIARGTPHGGILSGDAAMPAVSAAWASRHLLYYAAHVLGPLEEVV